MRSEQDFRLALLEFCRSLAERGVHESRLMAEAEERSRRDDCTLGDAVLDILRERPALAELVEDPELHASPRDAWEAALAQTRMANPRVDEGMVTYLSETNHPELAAIVLAAEEDEDAFAEACGDVGARSGEYSATAGNVVELVARRLRDLRELEEWRVRDAARQLAERERERKLFDEIAEATRKRGTPCR